MKISSKCTVVTESNSRQEPGSQEYALSVTDFPLTFVFIIIMIFCFLLLTGPITANGIGYTQDWLRGDQVGDSNQAKPNEGLRLADRTGWVAVGGTIHQRVSKKVKLAMNCINIPMAGASEANQQ